MTRRIIQSTKTFEGKKYKAAKWDEIENNMDEYVEYGRGTLAYISFMEYIEYDEQAQSYSIPTGKGEWCYNVMEKRGVWSWSSERDEYMTFNSFEECKDDLHKRFGGKWSFKGYKKEKEK